MERMNAEVDMTPGLQMRGYSGDTVVRQLQSRYKVLWVIYWIRIKNTSQHLPYMSYDLCLSNIKVGMAKGSPLEINKSPSQHQNPVGKLGMRFDIEYWKGD